jgi:hypothetical protein
VLNKCIELHVGVADLIDECDSCNLNNIVLELCGAVTPITIDKNTPLSTHTEWRRDFQQMCNTKGQRIAQYKKCARIDRYLRTVAKYVDGVHDAHLLISVLIQTSPCKLWGWGTEWSIKIVTKIYLSVQFLCVCVCV